MRINKMISLGMVLAIVLSVNGCGSAGAAENTIKESNIQTTAAAKDLVESKAAFPDNNTSEDFIKNTVSEDEKKTLIVYFSPANADTADAVSSATPRIGEVSSVEYMVQQISETVDADVSKIVPNPQYPTVYEKTADQAKAEQDNDVRPEFILDVNPEDYDMIFIGYPIWWYHLPMVMQTFFETYDFSGKTIIPFNTHAGSGNGGTYADIAELEPAATVLDGLAIYGEHADGATDSIKEWLVGLGY